MFIPAFTTNAITSDFLSSISPGWLVIFLDSNRAVFAFLGWLGSLGVVLALWVSVLKNFKSLAQGYRCRRFRGHLEGSSGHARSFIQIWWNTVSKISFWRNISPGHLQRSSLQTKEGQLRSLRRRVWPSDHREDDWSSVSPFCSLVQIFPKALHSD